MKLLSRIKLVNWHYFVDVTIDVQGSALITGDNGAGKSTILDAIQFVLTGGKARFNSAAHENARRNILGYVRCKTGADTEAYERKGDVTSHVALEFYEESKKKYFIVGVVIDSASDLNSPKELFYRIENSRISDELFIKGNTPINIGAFKISIKSMESRTFPTQTAAQADLCNRFGSFNDRFFNLLSKALAFRPINNIKDFVYSYVLDQKEVNIDYLKENVRTYREFEKVLKEIRLKIDKLEAIQGSHDEILRVQDNILINEYIIQRSRLEIERSNLDSSKRKDEAIHNNLKKLKEEETALTNEIDSIGSLIDEIRRSLLNNETFQIIDSLEKELKTLESECSALLARQKEFERCLKGELDRAQRIYRQGIGINGLDVFVTASKRITDPEGAAELALASMVLEDSYSTKHTEYIGKKTVLELEGKHLERAIEQLDADIKVLESKKLVFGENITKLRNIIFEEIKKQTGREEEPKILCELLHVEDPLWHDAVEGYLNTQRFDLIVPPQHFDISLDAYEAYKKRNKIHSVGLVNTQKVLEYENCDENTLASIVTSENRYAKCYINQLIGKVVCCMKVEDLKKHKRSITPTCMVYQNNTARQINPEVYGRPFIGADAYKKQLELKLKEKQEHQDRLKYLNTEIAGIRELIEAFSKPRLQYISENSDICVRTDNKKSEITEKRKQLERIDKSTIMQLQIELDGSTERKSSKEKLRREIYSRIGKEEATLEGLAVTIKKLEESFEDLTRQLAEFEEASAHVIARAKEKYDDELRSKPLNAVFTNFSGSKKGLETRLQNCTSDLKLLQSEYNNTFHFGAALGIEGMEAFQWEYRNLKESRMIEFEEKINNARKKAEDQFKEHFIAKLQENIYSAQQEFKKLNNALKGIKFGEDEYEFKCVPSKEYIKFYDMIMDEYNLGGDTLFTGAFQQKHKEAMSELFERIIIDDEQSQKALEKFTDYRTFLDYDIKIYHDNGNTSTFSKVCREKSGGETQTPYYVAIAASFLQLYNNALLKESIGLMLFDEAFDKMDENRIESMMKFLKKLNLQVIMASPPQKIESISPFVGTTMIVSREDKFSWVEALYINEEV